MDIDTLKFDTLRNALYHTARRQWLDWCNRALNFIVIAAGATAFADLAHDHLDPRWAAALAALAGILQLVFDFAGRARDHQILQRRYYDLMADMEGAADCSASDCAKWQGTLVRIYGDEPPLMRAVDAIAFNNASDALNRSDTLKVTRLQSMLRHLWAFNERSFPVVEGGS